MNPRIVTTPNHSDKGSKARPPNRTQGVEPTPRRAVPRRRGEWTKPLCPVMVFLLAGNSGAWGSGGDELPVVIRTADEGAITGGMVRFSLSDGVLLREGRTDPRHILTKDLVRLSAAIPILDPRLGEHVLTLAGGDTLRGRILRTDGDLLAVETADLGLLNLPLDAVSEISTSRASTAAYRQSAQWFQKNRPGHEDCVLLTNGDVVRGFIQSVDAEAILVETDAGASQVAFPLMVAARLAVAKPPPLPKAYLVVTLGTSGKLTATDLNWADGNVELRLRVGGTVRLLADRIIRVDVFGGRWEWLSDHAPLSFVHTPMLSVDWPLAKDRNVRGGALRVAGESYERGIGVHSRSHLTFALEGAYREFVASFGIDDESGPLADVTVSVLVDGRSRFEQRGVRRGRLHGPVRLDVRGAGRIELLVDFGENGDLQDRFNWVEPALVRE